MPQNFLYPQRDQPLLMPVDMREWLPEDDLVYLVLDAVDTLDLGAFRRGHRADGHGRAAFDPAMVVALLLYGYCQGERSSRQIERRCVRDVAYRVIVGGLYPDHATIARFRARHEKALGELFSQVLRLLAAEGMVSLGKLSLDGSKLSGNAAQKANRTLPQIEKLLAEAAAVDAAEDAELGEKGQVPTPRTLAVRAERRERLTQAPDRLAAEDTARREAQRAKQEAWDAAAAAGIRRGRRLTMSRPTRIGPAPNREPISPTRTCGSCRARRAMSPATTANSVTEQQVIVGGLLSQQPVDRTLLHPVLDTCRQQLTEAGIRPKLRTVLADAGYASEDNFTRAEQQKLRLLVPLRKDPNLHPNPPPRKRATTTLPATVRAGRRMRHHRGKADYKLRGQTVEPVFGQIKTHRKFSAMSRRGVDACTSEWLFVATAHNLRKLHVHRLSH